jgi:hypothetical protein
VTQDDEADQAEHDQRHGYDDEQHHSSPPGNDQEQRPAGTGGTNEGLLAAAQWPTPSADGNLFAAQRELSSTEKGLSGDLTVTSGWGMTGSVRAIGQPAYDSLFGQRPAI